MPQNNRKDWVPPSMLKFDPFADLLCAKVLANQVLYGIPASAVVALLGLQSNYDNARMISKNEKLSNSLQKETTQIALKHFKSDKPFGIRAFTKSFLKYNNNVPIADLTAMGIPIDGATRTHINPPAFGPELSSKPGKGVGTLDLYARIPQGEDGATKHVLPLGAGGGWEVRLKIGGPAPVSVKDYNIHILSGDTILTLTPELGGYDPIAGRGLAVYGIGVYLSPSKVYSPVGAPMPNTVIP